VNGEPASRRAATSADGAGAHPWPEPVAPGPSMRAVVLPRFGPPEVLREQPIPVPAPAPGEVLVQVAAVSIGRWLDLAARAGAHPYPGFTFPHVLGAEHAGVIAVIGPEVDGWQVGERVACFPALTDGSCAHCRGGDDELCPALRLIGIHRPGADAQYVAVPARNLHRVPDQVSPAQAAALVLSGAVAMNQLRRAGFRPGQWVLVQGASSALGSLTAGLARHLGGRVIATSRSNAKMKRLAQLDVDAILDPTSAGFGPALRELTAGRGADIVVDNLAEPRVWAASLAGLAAGGTLVSSGAFLGPQVQVDLRRLYLQGQRIVGVHTGNRASVSALWAEVARGFRPVLDAAFPLGQAAAAHRYLEAGQNVGRVGLLVPQPTAPGRQARPARPARPAAAAEPGLTPIPGHQRPAAAGREEPCA
jgi:NADPH:quinone reductase-like Zn-dependent oxidoreductase